MKKRSELYFIEVGDMLGLEDASIVMLYAPLKGATMMLRASEAQRLKDDLAEGDFDLSETGRTICKMRTRRIQVPPTKIEDIYEIDILSNLICNFNCVYCYSAKGRSDVELSFDRIRTLIDFLFSKEHPNEKPYKINFSGGGEPLMSFGLIKRTVAYIESKSRDDPHSYSLQMVTNGSLVTEEIADFLNEHHIKLVVSFEILPKFQNSERGNYECVAHAIDILLQKKNRFGIRATLTRDSADKMPEMVREIARRFVGLKSVVFDMVLSSDMFPTPESLESYYELFETRFHEAERVGKEFGIFVYCTAFRLLDFVRTRTCLGKMVLTPMGRLSICARISSPREKHYNGFTYGEVTDHGAILADVDGFRKFMEEDTIESNADCRTCYARWNCGGGCRLFRKSFSREALAVDCKFKRRLLKYQLFRRLSEEFEKTHSCTLREYIHKIVK